MGRNKGLSFLRGGKWFVGGEGGWGIKRSNHNWGG